MRKEVPVISTPSLGQISGAEGALLFETIDLEVAEMAMRYLPETFEQDQLHLAKLLFACCHHQTRNGSILFHIKELHSILFGSQLPAPERIEIERLFEQLDSRFHTNPANPIYWESAERLYLRKLWMIENETASAIARRFAPDPSTFKFESSGLNFPTTMTSLQISAATAPLTHPLVLVSGGPGTGKTFTIYQSIRVILDHNPNANIRLLAPTGKAVVRMQDSIRKGLSTNPGFPEVNLSNVKASTIHRFLRDRESIHARYHPFPRPMETVQYVIVDEASMVDLPLLHRLLTTLDAQTHLILVGDIHQLASVQPGAAFADLFDICATRRNPIPTIQLTDYFRFEESPELTQLCETIRKGDTNACLEQLQDRAGPSPIRYIEPTSADSINQMLKEWSADHIFPGVAIEDPVATLELYRNSMILCAQNEGPFGVNTLNRSITQACNHAFHRQGIHSSRDFYWKPVLIRKNDHVLQLFNGDFGILQQRISSAPSLKSQLACFHSSDGGLTTHADYLLPEYSDAFAYTIHKSQGSEADHVLLLLPDQTNPILSRELLYTAVSRAKKRLTIVAKSEILRFCIEHQTVRGSCLKERITNRTH